MKLARPGPIGRKQPVVVLDHGVRGLVSLTDDIDAACWESGGPSRIGVALAAGTLPLVADAADLRIGTPVARPDSIGRFPYLAPGDVVEVEIDGLGRQSQECLAFGASR